MTRLAASTCLTALFACSAVADLRSSPEVTVMFDFKGRHSRGATNEMEKEAAFILKDAGVNLSWRPLAGACNDFYNELVVMIFAGSCDMSPAPPI